MMEVVVTAGATRRAKLPVKLSPPKNNTQFLTGRMPFLSANQQCESSEGK